MTGGCTPERDDCSPDNGIVRNGGPLTRDDFKPNVPARQAPARADRFRKIALRFSGSCLGVSIVGSIVSMGL